MKPLENWDNNTWLSSKKYIFSFKRFLNSKTKINKNSKILDIGCGRANIISLLEKKYNFVNKPIGIDITKNKDIKKNIIFKKIDAIKYLKNNNINFDLILIKQTIHFFKKKELIQLLNLTKKNLSTKGIILILSLKNNKNELPTFKIMKKKLENSLLRDKRLFKVIKKNLIKYKKTSFKFQVLISKKKYIKMLKKRYISCLLNVSKKDIKEGIMEFQTKYKNRIKFNDILDCLIYQN
jgi:ubiquinone/menaquinone biosynthesis C-methylase UbiE